MYIKQTHKILDVILKWTGNKVAFIKIIFDVWENKIMPALYKVHDTRWLGFDGEYMMKTMSFIPAVAK